MPQAPLPPDEDSRLQSLYKLNVLDTAPEEAFDSLVKIASLVCNVPISLITLIDKDRQWFKANIGLEEVEQTSRDVAFCAHTILQDELLEVEDATGDTRFLDNPFVTGSPEIRFYAGVPLLLKDGSCIGSLCVIDTKSRQLSSYERDVLQHLARAATQGLEARSRLATSESLFRTLSDASPMGIYATDAEGGCTYTNTRWQEIYGLSLEESQGHGWSKTLHPDEKDAVFAEWQRTAALRADFDMEFRVQRPDGTTTHVHSLARPMVSNKNEITGFVGCVKDMNDRVLQNLEIKEARDRIGLATESGEIGIWDYDIIHNTLKWDTWMYRLHGHPPQTGVVDYEFWFNHVHPDDRDHIQKAGQDAVERGKPLDTEFRIVWSNGTIRHIRTSAKIKRDEHGNAIQMIGANWDITAQRQLGLELAEQHELMRVTLQSIGDAVVTTDANGLVSWLNPVAERMTGWLNQEAKGLHLSQIYNIIDQETREAFEDPVTRCLQKSEPVNSEGQTILVSKEGHEFAIEDSAAPIFAKAGDIIGIVLVFHDETEKRKISGEMRYRATHDALTGLMNRAEFEVRLTRSLKRAHEEHSEHSVMFIDLDQFKIVNDTCGHAVGDQLLQQVTKLLQDSVRLRDIVARLGGDEFAIILEYCTVDQARRVAQKICDRMEEFRFIHDEQRFRIGTSIGLVPINQSWSSITSIMQAADSCCYAAKEAGRNRVHLWDDTDQAIQERHGEMQWTTRIEQALDEDRFVLFAQRIKPLDVPAHNSSLNIHAEVLIRLVEKDGSLIMPGAFLPSAERFHLAPRLDKWVFRKAMEWLEAVPDLSHLSTLCVNLSGQSIGDRTFHRYIIETLKQADTNIVSRLCFEITETSAITNLVDASLFIQQARELGVRIALDDFGAGASSFGYLKTLTVDFLKIDGQFIRDLLTNPLSEAAVMCFAHVAKVMNIKTIAEFVNEESVLLHLKNLGIHYAQGYMVHKPEPIELMFASASADGPLQEVNLQLLKQSA